MLHDRLFVQKEPGDRYGFGRSTALFGGLFGAAAKAYQLVATLLRQGKLFIAAAPKRLIPE
jgi:hypothetical protein